MTPQLSHSGVAEKLDTPGAVVQKVEAVPRKLCADAMVALNAKTPATDNAVNVVHVDSIPSQLGFKVGSVSTTYHGAWVSTTETREVLAKRYTYACTRFRAQGATST